MSNRLKITAVIAAAGTMATTAATTPAEAGGGSILRTTMEIAKCVRRPACRQAVREWIKRRLAAEDDNASKTELLLESLDQSMDNGLNSRKPIDPTARKLQRIMTVHRLHEMAVNKK